jgi:pimeloyl-ACP methyl ester carboxylesterase
VQPTVRMVVPACLPASGTGPSLLVLHGRCADHSAWDSVVPLLADTFTVYAMDRRGRGGSGDAPEYALEREIEDVVAAVEALPAPVYVYGHSFGGVCAVEAASRARNLARLVLYEGGPIRVPRGVVLVPEEFLVRLEQLIGTDEREEAVSTFMLNSAGVTPAELEVLRGNPAWSSRVAAAQTVPRELRAISTYAPDVDRVSAIEVPVLMVVGEQTDPLRRTMWEQLASLSEMRAYAYCLDSATRRTRLLQACSPTRCAIFLSIDRRSAWSLRRSGFTLHCS